MAQNSNHFSMEEARRLSQTTAGQKLLSLLQSQSPQQLQTAMNQASRGEYDQLKKTLGALMSSPEAQALLKQLEKNPHE